MHAHRRVKMSWRSPIKPMLPGGVICFPINAPGMGRVKLFDSVGYS